MAGQELIAACCCTPTGVCPTCDAFPQTLSAAFNISWTLDIQLGGPVDPICVQPCFQGCNPAGIETLSNINPMGGPCLYQGVYTPIECSFDTLDFGSSACGTVGFNLLCLDDEQGVRWRAILISGVGAPDYGGVPFYFVTFIFQKPLDANGPIGTYTLEGPPRTGGNVPGCIVLNVDGEGSFTSGFSGSLTVS